MNFFTNISIRFRRWRRRQVAMRQKSALREFVYLDEVSVYSLIASRLGPVAAEFTETQTASLQGEIGGSVGAGVGFAKADVSSHVLNSQTKGSQVVRKSIVQATFKDLYELEFNSLSIRPVSENQRLPKIRDFDELKATSASLEGSAWIIDPENLTRGNLFELEVQLEADAIFRVNSVASAILEILEEDAEMFGLDSSGDLGQIKSVGRILEKLLAGLVPVRGEAVDYCVVENEGKELIVHTRLLKELSTLDSSLIRPLYVVGVAEQALFWKDIRHILFSKGHYRVLCRLTQDGLRDSWSPVKLAHVFESVVPGLATQMNFSGLDAIAKITDSSNSNQNMELKQQLAHDTLVNYAKLLADHFEKNITLQIQEKINLLADQHCVSFGNQKGRRAAFESIAAYLIDSFDLKKEPLVFAQYRAIALNDAGLDLSGKPASLTAANNAVSPTAPQERFLDSEFVAIYW